MEGTIKTNNNAWTLLKHAAQSVNKAAGKIDQKIYGPVIKVEPPKPAPKPTNFFEVCGFVVVAAVCIVGFFLWLSKWEGRAQRVGEKIWGKD